MCAHQGFSFIATQPGEPSAGKNRTAAGVKLQSLMHSSEAALSGALLVVELERSRKVGEISPPAAPNRHVSSIHRRQPASKYFRMHVLAVGDDMYDAVGVANVCVPAIWDARVDWLAPRIFQVRR